MPPRDRRRAGLCLFAGSVEFAIGLTIAEAFSPAFSISHDFLGDLGLGPTALLFNGSIVLLGLAFLAGAWFLLGAFRNWPLSIAVALAGMGAIGFGVVPATDAYQFLFRENAIHTGAALLTFLFGALSAVLAFQVLRPPLRYGSAALGLASLATLGLMVTGTSVGLDRGIMEQLILWPVLLWGMGMGGYLLIPPSAASQQPLPAGPRSA